METYFAPPERASAEELAKQIKLVSRNPVMSGLLHSVNGLLAVVNEHRQVIALNESFLEMIGIQDPAETLGLRPGEVLKCIHAADEPGGCGTSQFCSTCGAAISMVASLGQNKPMERMCALTAVRNDRSIDLVLMVRSHPIIIEKKRFLLLFLQDITLQQHRAALERTFFHDINNMLAMLVQASELLIEDFPSEQAETIYQAALLLHQQIDIQRSLSESGTGSYRPKWHEIELEQIMVQLRSFFASHPAAGQKRLDFSDNLPNINLNTDLSILLRVLCNMIINALEASDLDQPVKIWVESDEAYLTFCVWNRQYIPDVIARRIFQRNFSTKSQPGRGIGTFSIKLFGEKILGGKVSFTSSENQGTFFRFAHPL